MKILGLHLSRECEGVSKDRDAVVDALAKEKADCASWKSSVTLLVGKIKEEKLVFEYTMYEKEQRIKELEEEREFLNIELDKEKAKVKAMTCSSNKKNKSEETGFIRVVLGKRKPGRPAKKKPQ